MGQAVGALIGGIAAAVVGGMLGVVTTYGVVNTVQDSPREVSTQVVDYGSR